MKRVDYIEVNEEDQGESLAGGIVLLKGKLQRTEGNQAYAEILLGATVFKGAQQLSPEKSPSLFLDGLNGAIGGTSGYASEAYDDPDELYDKNGIYVGDEEHGFSIDKPKTPEQIQASQEVLKQQLGE